MRIGTIPGTVLPYHSQMGTDTFSMVSSLCSAAGGFSLSQIVGITGLEPSTIQNWVKRGWVSRPTGKKYNQRQIARILLISVLRDSLPLEKIVKLMSFVNGSVDDRSDDIIDEGELYDRLCALLFQLDGWTVTRSELQKAIHAQLDTYHGPQPDAKERLAAALEIMVMAYIASTIRKTAETCLDGLLNEALPSFF